MGGGGLAHFLVPDQFSGFIFDPLPKFPVIYAAGVLQIGIAVAALTPRTRGLAALSFAALCTLYLPLHIWDLLRDDAVITPLSAAVIRVIVQFAFIAMGLVLWRRMRQLGQQ